MLPNYDKVEFMLSQIRMHTFGYRHGFCWSLGVNELASTCKKKSHDHARAQASTESPPANLLLGPGFGFTKQTCPRSKFWLNEVTALAIVGPGHTYIHTDTHAYIYTYTHIRHMTYTCIQADVHTCTILPASNIGALIIRIGFWAHCTITITRNPENSIGNYLGPCTKPHNTPYSSPYRPL